MWIRGMCRRVVHGIVHRAAMMRMWWYLQLTMGLVSVYETEFVFRSLMAWGKKLFLSLSVFAIMLLKRLPDGSKQKRWLPGWVESLRILAALLLQRWGRCAAERGRADPEMRSAKRYDSLQSFTVLVCGIIIPYWDALSQYTSMAPD